MFGFDVFLIFTMFVVAIHPCIAVCCKVHEMHLAATRNIQIVHPDEKHHKAGGIDCFAFDSDRVSYFSNHG